MTRPVTSDPAGRTLAEWQQRVGEVNRENGWRTGPLADYARPDKQVSLLALIVTEVAEAIEEVRNGHGPDEAYWSINGVRVYPVRDGSGADWTSDPGGSSARGHFTWAVSKPKPEGVAAELADVVIRSLDFADLYGIDLESAIAEKLAYNATRGHRHGGKTL